MRWFALVLLLALHVPPAPAQSTFEAVDAYQEDGAYSLIIVPRGWNGAFIVYAHGYTADYRDIRPYPPDLTPANIASKLTGADAILQVPLALGYAVGTTTYRSVGWAVGDAWRDVDNVRRRFRKRHGTPRFTYVWGHSEGGIVTQTVIEKEPHAYDGALPLCAPGAGGRRNLNAAWDLRATYEYTCAGVPDAEFRCNVCTGGTARCLDDGDCPSGQTCGALEPAFPPQWGLTPECTEFLLKKPGAVNEEPRFGDFVARHAQACFGGTTPTPEQQARRDLFLRGTRIPADFLFTDLFFASVALGEVRNRRTNGGIPWSNDGVTYQSPELTPAELAAFNAGVPRATNDAAATEYLRRSYEPRGRTDTKILTLQALDDGLVIPENQEKYREAFATVGRGDQLVQIYTPTGGHCGFSIAEHVATLAALFQWVEVGAAPTVAAVQAACAALAPVVGGACRIQDADPGEWGERVVERRQNGLKLRTLVCDGDPEDCPVDAACSERLDRCVE
jgi:pimeloyl-ACP methyl ester carboxylesterase